MDLSIENEPELFFGRNFVRIGFDRYVIILAMILYTTLQHEIGLKSSKEGDSNFLGARDREVVLITPSTFLDL